MRFERERNYRWVISRECYLINGQNEIFDRLWYPLSILMLVAIGAKLIGPLTVAIRSINKMFVK